jgi:putative ABC transport system ATP-binding protein
MIRGHYYEYNGIRKVYGSKHDGSESKSLNGVSFSAENGEFLGIMEPSGSGTICLYHT